MRASSDGIAWQLPALTLYTKLLRKAALADLAIASEESSLAAALEAIAALTRALDGAGSYDESQRAWGDALSSLVAAAQLRGRRSRRCTARACSRAS